MGTLILASASPRRQDMLARLGVDFTVETADVDEAPLPREKPRDYVLRVAHAKLEAIVEHHPDSVVLAADTTVALGRRIVGKPADAAEATAMLKRLHGRSHRVYTAVCLYLPGAKTVSKLTDTRCTMVPLRKKDIAAYVADEANWRGKAGAYGLQDARGGALIKRITGSHSGVIGLPLAETVTLLRSAGLDV